MQKDAPMFSHLQPAERQFYNKAMDWVSQVDRTSVYKRTDFLDPRQAHLLQSLVNLYPGQHVSFHGGEDHAERCRAIITPDYWEPNLEDFGLVILEVTSIDQRLSTCDHGDYLGAVLGLGIKRERLGDIHPIRDECHIVVAEEIVEFLNIHLRQVHRVNVMTTLRPIHELKVSLPTVSEMSLTVSSTRLDTVASDVFRMSRAKIVDPIKSGRCRVNWKVEESISVLLKSGDVVSIKGLGRFIVLEVGNQTKKGNTRVKIGRYV